MSEQIGKCPYCGSDNVSITSTWGKYFGKCNGCGACGPEAQNYTDAVLLWNAAANALRKVEDERDALRAALEQTEEERHETVSKLSLALIREAAGDKRQDELEAEIERMREHNKNLFLRIDLLNEYKEIWYKSAMESLTERDEARRVARHWYNAANAWMKNWTELINALPARNEPQSVRVTETSDSEG